MPALTELEQSREKKVYFQREGKQQELAEYLRKYGRKLYGSDIYYDLEGNIFFKTWPQAQISDQDDSLGYLLISDLPPQAKIYAPHSRYRRRIEKRINQLPDVETGIRAMNHILENELGKETAQAKGIGTRARQLMDFFAQQFGEINEEDFLDARDKTYALLTQVNLNPTTVVDEEKRKMANWLTKGSFGKDSLGRRNWLISMGALSAAYARATNRQKGIAQIVGKFVRMRWALEIERELARGIFTDVIDRLRPEALPAHTLFKYPERPGSNRGIVTGILNTLIFQLEQPHIKTYRSIALEAKKPLEEAVKLLNEDKRSEIVERKLFPQVYTLLTTELIRRKDIYPQEAP